MPDVSARFGLMEAMWQIGLALGPLLLLLLMGARASLANGWSKRLAAGSATLAFLLLIDLLLRRLPVYSGWGREIQIVLGAGAVILWIASAVSPGYRRRWPDIAMVLIPATIGILAWASQQ